MTTLKAPKRYRPCLSQQLSLCFPREMSLPLSSEKCIFYQIAYDSKSFKKQQISLT